MMLLPVNDVYKKAFEHDTAIEMILDGQCGQFNPVLLKCLKELSLQFSKMYTNETNDNKQYYGSTEAL